MRQPVKFLRLSPGEQIEMAQPHYFITLPGVSVNALLGGRTTLVAGFGPEGQMDVFLSGPVGGPREVPPLAPKVPQTIICQQDHVQAYTSDSGTQQCTKMWSLGQNT